MVQNTVEISAIAPLSYLSIDVTNIELEKLSVTDM